MIAETTAFDQYALEYDEWFDRHANMYQSELLALKEAIPKNKTGIEIGAGTGRFAQPLNIKCGVEPSAEMAQIAKQRGVKIISAFAEALPIDDQSYDFATMVTTVCFLENIPKAFSEVYRILKPKGEFIIGLIDRNSALGRKYEQQKGENKFYKDAHFHSTEEITELLKQSGFKSFAYWQTLEEADKNKVESPKTGYGVGSFVIIKANKQ